MKLKMTVDEALEFADEWSRGLTLHEDSQGWRVVCMLLAEEVRRERMALDEIVRVLGLAAPTCEGCSHEIGEALRIAMSTRQSER